MSKEIQTKQQGLIAAAAALENAVMGWDFSGLNEVQRLTYLKSVCKEIGLNFKLNPFSYIKFQGKVIPYLNAGGTAQLRSINKISSKIMSRGLDKETNIFTIIVAVTAKDGRTDEAMGAISIAGLRGVDLVNAYLKCETKAKRRATLSLTGMLKFDTPTGEEEPIRATEIAERVESVSAKIETTERPEFEKAEAETVAKESASVADNPPDVNLAVSSEPCPPETGYVMRGGKNKGKMLKDLSRTKLKKLVSVVDEWLQAGKPVHPEVQDDAFHARALLEEQEQP